MEKPPKVVYEWVLVMSKGDDTVLSENQYNVYREQVKAKDLSRKNYGKTTKSRLWMGVGNE